MNPWNERPFEIAYLLNPAFCSLLIRESVYSYTNEEQHGLPYALAFLTLPIILHQTTRKALPDRASTRMFDWLDRHPHLKTGFAGRTKSLVPYTRESIIFGIQKDILAIETEGRLRSVNSPSQPSTWPSTSEASECQERARFLGRWYAQTGDATTIFRLWGVRP